MGQVQEFKKKKKKIQIVFRLRYHQLTPWRNGSASDSRSEGCVFESRRGQLTFYAIILITISIEKNVKPVLKGVEIMKRKMLLCWKLLSFVLIKVNEVKGAGGWGVQEVKDEDLCFSMTQRAGEGLEGTSYNTP